MQKINPCLWFDDNAEEAVNFYISVFEDSRIKEVTRYGEATADMARRPAGSVMTLAFELHGQEYLALNGGPLFQFTPAVSFCINCETQEEVDRLWEALSADGAQEPCGWLRDRFGVSWQVVPTALTQMMQDPDPGKSKRLVTAMLKMKKLDIRQLEEAYNAA